MKILNTIVSLSSVILIAAIVILIYALAPIKNSNFQWPSTVSNDNTDTPTLDFIDEVLLVQESGVEVVKRHCTGCHSARLITQNRMSQSRWEDNIRWMQDTQGLWDLGKDHTTVIAYLAEYYAPQKMGRRRNINMADIEWYILKE